MKIKGLNLLNVLSFAGVVIAFLMGSGFSTGQEVLQYYVSYGYNGILVALTFAAIFIYANYHFAKSAAKNNFKKCSDIFTYYCGQYIGKFFDIFTVIFCFSSYIVMLAGAGAVLNQEYGLDIMFGVLILAVLTSFTVLYGLGSIVKTLRIIGPVVAILCVSIGFITVIRDFNLISAGLNTIERNDIVLLKATPHWLLSAFSYVGFCSLWFAGFITELGMKNKYHEVLTGVILGIVCFLIGLLLTFFALLSNIDIVYNVQIPNLILAKHISPIISSCFSIIIICGSYTASIPLLWTPVARFTKEKTKPFVLLTISLVVLGLFIAMLVPFSKLINVIFVISGYVGIIFVLFILFKETVIKIFKRGVS